MEFLRNIESPRDAHVGDDAIGTRGELFEQLFRWLVKETDSSVELGYGSK